MLGIEDFFRQRERSARKSGGIPVTPVTLTVKAANVRASGATTASPASPR